MSRSTRRSLFGGALFAAGLIDPTASAQKLVWGESKIGAYAADESDLDPFNKDSFDGSGPFQISAATDHSSSTAWAEQLAFHVDCASTAQEYLGAGYSFSSDFTMSGTQYVYFFWDLEAGQSWNHDSPYMKLDDVTHGVNLLTADKFANPTGYTGMYLFKGTDYTLHGAVSAFDGAGKSYFYMEVFIPSPGAAPALALAGLAAAKRRRTRPCRIE